ncbi:DUF4158 domain-containing protein [Streptomyces sp. FXJ1.4098]|nr:DUF4158 domain-containing protein [Streptomyces sp. FXJ1.4098]
MEFLTAEQAEAYGKFAEEPTRPELERFCYLDDVDRAPIGKRRGDQNRLGFALQMCTVRYVGLFLEDPLAVPWPVIEHLGQELGIEDVSCIKQYTERLKTAYEHAWEIRDAYGYHQYEDPEWGRSFRTFPHGRAWTNAEGPVALHDVLNEDVARVSPLKHANLNCLGRYSFAARHARACAHCVTRRPSTSTRTTRAPANDAASGRVPGRDQ